MSPACPIAGQWSAPGGPVAVDCDPVPPFGLLVALLAALALALTVLAEARRRRRGGGPAWPCAAVIAAGALTAAFLALAALNPHAERVPEPAGRHLVVAVDVSASARRPAGSLDAALDRAAALVAAVPGQAADWTGGVVAFGAGALPVASSVAYADLPGALSAAAGPDGPPPDGTDIAAGLAAAGDLVAAGGRAGAVLLVGDGLATAGDARAAAAALGRQGIPVHVVPTAGAAPGIGVAAADLPPTVAAGAETAVRAVLANPGAAPAAFTVSWQQGDGAAATAEHGVPARGWAPLRIPTRFAGRGLDWGELSLTAADGRRQVRRLVTRVAAPVRVLVLGGAGWTRALPAEAYTVTTAAPDAPFDPAAWDVVVIDGVATDRLAPGQADRLAEAVQGAGTGLLLVNGAHRGPEDAPTLLMRYERTALGPLLPVTSEPRLVRDEPPPRDVILVIDTSGSMDGWKLAHARDIAAVVVGRLTWRDSARILTFSGGVQELLPRTAMDPAGRAAARARLARLTAAGGTDPTGALRLVEREAGARCGMFFLSDGEFDQEVRPPGCMTTVFGIGQTAANINPEVYALGEVHPVGFGFDSAAIRLGFFEPPPRPRTFEPGPYEPEPAGGTAGYLPDPPLPLEGTAVTYARGDAELAAVRPWPYDPVLAFREAGAGSVGVLTTALPARWLDAPGGSGAVRAWIDRVAGWSARDRYLVDGRDRGDALRLRIALAGDGTEVPAVTGMTAALHAPDGRRTAVALTPDPALYGVFTGTLPLPDEGGRGVLVLSERGDGALPRDQRIPVRLPPRRAPAAAATAEAWTHGTDGVLLAAIAEASGGVLDPEPADLAPAAPPVAPRVALFPWLLVAAGAGYLVQIGIRRFAP